MTPTSIREYLAAQRARYRLASRTERSRRHLVGYDRYTSKAAYAQLVRVYRLLRLHTNFFQPVQRLVHKTRHGARVHRVHDRAQTTYERLCAAGVLPPTTRQELKALYRGLNPLRLHRQIDAELSAVAARGAGVGTAQPDRAKRRQTSETQTSAR